MTRYKSSIRAFFCALTVGMAVSFISACGGPGYLAAQRGEYFSGLADDAYHKAGAVNETAKNFYLQVIDQYNSAEKFGYSGGRMYMERGYAYLQLSQPAKAQADLNKSVALYSEELKSSPNDASLWNLRGWSYDLLGKYDQAKADAEKSLKLNGGDGNTHDTLAVALAGLGDDEAALKEYNAAIKFLPDNGLIWMHRAECYKRLGQPELAKQDLLKAKMF